LYRQRYLISTTAFWNLAAIRINFTPLPKCVISSTNFASVVGTLLGLFIFLGLGTGGLLLLLIAVASRDTGPQVNKSVLVLTCPKHHRCETKLWHQLCTSGSIKGRITTVTCTVLDTLEKARRDKRIVGIYLNGSRSSEATGTILPRSRWRL